MKLQAEYIYKKRKLKVTLTALQLCGPVVKWSIICQPSTFRNISSGNTALPRKYPQLKISENKTQCNGVFLRNCETNCMG